MTPIPISIGRIQKFGFSQKKTTGHLNVNDYSCIYLPKKQTYVVWGSSFLFLRDTHYDSSFINEWHVIHFIQLWLPFNAREHLLNRLAQSQKPLSFYLESNFLLTENLFALTREKFRRFSYYCKRNWFLCTSINYDWGINNKPWMREEDANNANYLYGIRKRGK